jgi:hypothetical protein
MDGKPIEQQYRDRGGGQCGSYRSRTEDKPGRDAGQEGQQRQEDKNHSG